MRKKTIGWFVLFICSLFLFEPIFTARGQSQTANPGDGLVNQAISMYYQGDFNGSLQNLRRISAISPDNNGNRLNLIRLLREAGQYDEALLNLNYLLKQNPNDPTYRLAFIQTAYLAGHPELVQTGPESADNATELFWQGLALFDQGKDPEAENVIKQSLNLESFNPVAYYILGQITMKKKYFEDARTFFRKALSQEPNFTLAFYPLAKCHIALEQLNTAYNLLLNAQSASPDNQEVKALLKQLLEEHPDLAITRQQEKEKKRTTIIPPMVKAIIENREVIPEIRIGLVEKVEQLYLKTGDSFTLKSQVAGLISGKAQEVLFLRCNQGVIEVVDAQGVSLIKSSQSLVLSYENPGATSVLFDIECGKGYFYANHEDRIYRGIIQLIPGAEGLTIVNRLNIEEYLYSVVPSEMSSSWPAAAQQAQAIAARTYTFANMGQFKARGYDLSATVISQAYNGVSQETPAATAAVNATRGKIATYNGKPIAAFFTGNSGGHTESSQNVWNFNLPYLQAVPDKLLPPKTGLLPPNDLAKWLVERPQTYSSNPKYSSRSSYRWVKWVPRTEIEKRINLGKTLGNITALITVGRGSSGLVQRVLVRGTSGEYTVKGDAIRSKLGGIRSNLFTVEPKMGADGLPEFFIFTGGGWGHGVGMCQSGAAGMAADNYTSAEILTHYYPGTELTKRY